MLSRVAHSLYWMSRYLERAENTARLVDVNLQLLLDFRAGDEEPTDYWLPIVDSTGERERYLALHPVPDGPSAVEFLVFDPANPTSLVESVSRARENAGTVRDQLTAELWEEINRLYLFLRSEDAHTRFAASPADFFERIKNATLLLTGLGHATVMRGEGWQFVEVGRYLERGDQTTRILDVLHAAFPERGTPDIWSERNAIEWAAVLRSCSAWDAYKSLYGANVEPTRVVGFLLLNEDFPRSVRFCAEEVDAALRRISGVADGRFANAAEQRSGRFLAELRFAAVEDLLAERGLHAYLDLVQARLAGIADAVAEVYVERVTREPAPAPQAQAQQQQQQQQQQTLRVNA
jgi:uncharacterized alpha-E superfamily protein